jgi:hypothetical protein
MSTAPAIRLTADDDPLIPQIARMLEAYFKSLEEQAVRLENFASKLEDEDKRATLDFVVGLQKEVQAMREQMRLFAD